ncbi:MAG: hypothetical protein ACKO38_03880 [Planctomycetota bacterium]
MWFAHSGTIAARLAAAYRPQAVQVAGGNHAAFFWKKLRVWRPFFHKVHD